MEAVKQYHKAITELCDKILNEQYDAIVKAAEMVADAIERGNVLDRKSVV